MGRKWRTMGYIAARPGEGRVVVCIFDPEGKKYYVADLAEVRQVVHGLRGYAKLYGPRY